MVILVANQKGGCGKTTVSIQLANYLATKGVELLAIDTDFQGSFYDRREDDKKTFPDNEILYEVIKAEAEEIPKIIENVSQVENAILLIDFPGKLDDDNLIHILMNADIIVIPFAYDYNTVESTITFGMVLQKLKVPGKLFFLPNRIKSSAKYDTKEQVNEVFSNWGIVLDEIPDRVIFERGSTLEIGSEAEKVVKLPFDTLIEQGKILTF
ncbi:ParA family protein [Parabacteroides sp. PF5-9]|uniref:ParA family protein n=1 Tax=Parabacteroides sp. PF5-9 TaxID=1742404 RepID=UPI0024768BBA|nr:ParA family protein [Parabacteroides sp. PF5-9]MDH6358935.1 chromosome partitioning protein [Parabacteroides sp. PF5-9]